MRGVERTLTTNDDDEVRLRHWPQRLARRPSCRFDEAPDLIGPFLDTESVLVSCASEVVTTRSICKRLGKKRKKKCNTSTRSDRRNRTAANRSFGKFGKLVESFFFVSCCSSVFLLPNFLPAILGVHSLLTKKRQGGGMVESNNFQDKE